ncbi:MAG: LPS export ABC transporter permease LptF [Gammaproteobacteria bacterium]|nr:LPS export ABC transporter permease LptF [Gammaproteobacteria bacterium]
MKILQRYFIREVLLVTLAVTAILVAIFLCNQLIRYLGDVAEGKLASWVMLDMMLLLIPLLTSFLLPLGFFLGLLLAYGRLYADSEMVVVFAAGFERWRLLVLTLFLGLIMAAFVAFLTLWLNPRLMQQKSQLLSRAIASSLAERILPGTFQSMAGGREIVYVSKLSRDRQKMQDLFFAQQLNDSSDGRPSWAVLFAKGGYQAKRDGQSYIVLTDGYRYQGRPGQHRFASVRYNSYGLKMAAKKVNKGEDLDALPTEKLWPRRRDPDVASALQWRLSSPLSTLVLALLAVPLSRSNPRRGRFTWLFPATLIAIVYVNLILFARHWIEQGYVPVWLGMWWIHLLFLLLAIYFILSWMFPVRLHWRRSG